jgi:uncharacterized protein
MSHTLSLFRLQQIDTQIDRLKIRLNNIQKELDDDAEVSRVNEQIKTATSRCQNAEQALIIAENQVQNQLIKIEQTQSSLYGSKSHSPKELQDLQNDLAALKRYLVTLEDRQIDAMQESESAETDQRLVLTELKTITDKRTQLFTGLRQEQAILQNDLDRFSTERNAVAGGIPSTEIILYDQLRQQRRGIAVAVIADNSCQACGSILSLAQIQSARSSGLMVLCPSCGRILYGS